MNPAPHHRVDVHVKFGMFREQLELLVQNLQAFFRDIVRHNVVDRDLHVLEARPIQLPYAVRRQQIAVRDHARDRAAPADTDDQVVEFGVQQWFAAAERNDAGAEIGEQIDPPDHFSHRNRLREIVELIAVCACQITAPGGNDVGEHRMVGRTKSFGQHQPFARTAVYGNQTSSEANSKCRHSRRKHYYNTPLQRPLQEKRSA